jgi:regulator of protease activity HflC (stomatin/prohibitin superfamily)
LIFSSKKTKELNLKLEESQKQLSLVQSELEKERAKNQRMESELENLKAAVIAEAEREAQSIIEEARKKYEKEFIRLRIFVERWQNALPEPKEVTPESRKRRALAVALSEILKDNPCNSDIDEGVKLLEKLTNAINGGAGNGEGFNLEEVLNPGSELDLAALCKELGVMD